MSSICYNKLHKKRRPYPSIRGTSEQISCRCRSAHTLVYFHIMTEVPLTQSPLSAGSLQDVFCGSPCRLCTTTCTYLYAKFFTNRSRFFRSLSDNFILISVARLTLRLPNRFVDSPQIAQLKIHT